MFFPQAIASHFPPGGTAINGMQSHMQIDAYKADTRLISY